MYLGSESKDLLIRVLLYAPFVTVHIQHTLL